VTVTVSATPEIFMVMFNVTLADSDHDVLLDHRGEARNLERGRVAA
jgi:hypothetical protein